MKARSVIFGALSLMVLFGGMYVCQRDGDVSSISGAYSSGSGKTGSGLGQLANSLWMTMVNAELGRVGGRDGQATGPGGTHPHGPGSLDGTGLGPDGAAGAYAGSEATAARPSGSLFSRMSSFFFGSGDSNAGRHSVAGANDGTQPGAPGQRGGAYPGANSSPAPAGSFFGRMSSFFFDSPDTSNGATAASNVGDYGHTGVGRTADQAPAPGTPGYDPTTGYGPDGSPAGLAGEGTGAYPGPAAQAAPAPAGSLFGRMSAFFFGSSASSNGATAGAYAGPNAGSRASGDNRGAFVGPGPSSRSGFADGTEAGSGDTSGSGVGANGGAYPVAQPAPAPAGSIFGRMSAFFFGSSASSNGATAGAYAGPNAGSRASGDNRGAFVDPGPSNRSGSGDGANGGAYPAAQPAPAPAGSLFGRVSAFFFGGDTGSNSNSGSFAGPGSSSGGVAVGPGVGTDGSDPARGNQTGDGTGAFAANDGLDGAAGYGNADGVGEGGATEATAGTEIAAAQTENANEGRDTARDRKTPAPRAVPFATRLQSRADLLARQREILRRIAYPMTVGQVRSSGFNGFLQRSHVIHTRWYNQRAQLITEYNREQRRDRQAIEGNFRAAQARDRQAGGQTNLRNFMRQSRDFNRRRAAQNNEFQALLDQTGRRLSSRFQYLFQLSLRRHIASEASSAPDQNGWREKKAGSTAAVNRVYADRRAPALSRDVNRGVRNYMRHWVAFFYNKKIEGATPRLVETDPEPEPGPGPEPVVEKFQPQENCGPTDLHTYSLDRMRNFVKSLESNCPAANGLPDILLKTCATYHVQMDLKVACKRDIYFFLKFDSENRYDRNRGIGHFSDGCRPYRSIEELSSNLIGDPNRGIDSLQKDRMNRMLDQMRSCGGGSGSVSPPPVREPAPAPTPPRETRPSASDLEPSTNPGTNKEPEVPELVPSEPTGKEPEAPPELEEMKDLSADEEAASPEAAAAEETLATPES